MQFLIHIIKKKSVRKKERWAEGERGGYDGKIPCNSFVYYLTWYLILDSHLFDSHTRAENFKKREKENERESCKQRLLYSFDGVDIQNAKFFWAFHSAFESIAQTLTLCTLHASFQRTNLFSYQMNYYYYFWTIFHFVFICFIGVIS